MATNPEQEFIELEARMRQVPDYGTNDRLAHLWDQLTGDVSVVGDSATDWIVERMHRDNTQFRQLPSGRWLFRDDRLGYWITAGEDAERLLTQIHAANA